MKLCSYCKVVKADTEFHLMAAARDKLQAHCKKCTSTQRAAHYRANTEKAKARSVAWQKANTKRMQEIRRKAKYGIHPSDYAAMVVAQAGLCAICGVCGKIKTLHIDHDHTTGKIRGLLCNRCNTALGGFKDSYTNLIAATAYLKKWKTDSLI